MYRTIGGEVEDLMKGDWDARDGCIQKMEFNLKRAKEK